MELLTVAEYAAREGLSPRTVREHATLGRIRGAQRVGVPGSPWVLPWPPLNDDTPAASGGGVSDTFAEGPDVRSAYGIADALNTYTACVSTVGQVTTRPSRALPVALAALVAVVSRHSLDRDGACAACGWTYPCADVVTARTALDAVASVVLDGAA